MNEEIQKILDKIREESEKHCGKIQKCCGFYEKFCRCNTESEASLYLKSLKENEKN